MLIRSVGRPTENLPDVEDDGVGRGLHGADVEGDAVAESALVDRDGASGSEGEAGGQDQGEGAVDGDEARRGEDWAQPGEDAGRALVQCDVAAGGAEDVWVESGQ